TGWVSNDTHGLVAEVEGSTRQLQVFLERLQREHPANALIQRIDKASAAPVGYGSFSIRPSEGGGRKTALVLPDLATCAQCVREIFDPSNRRYRYPFTNCTNCGPRFSIIQRLPYDRPNTTMSGFVM